MDVIADNKVAVQDENYLSLSEFHQQLDEKESNSPYSSSFSFAPLIAQVKERHQNNLSPEQREALHIMQEFEKLLAPYVDADSVEQHLDKIELILPLLFPALFFEGQLGFVSSPLSRGFSYLTPNLQHIFDSQSLEIKAMDFMKKNMAKKTVLEAGKIILKQHYGYDLDFVFSDTITIRDRNTKLEKHYKIHIIQDYIQAKALKPLKELSDKQLYQLANEWDNTELWLECIPPENFAFEGLAIGYFSDVTKVEIISKFKQLMVENNQAEEPGSERDYIAELIRSFLETPDIRFGVSMSPDLDIKIPDTWSLMGEPKNLRHLPKDYAKGYYGRVIQQGEAQVVGDLERLPKRAKMEDKLFKLGYRSLLLAPMRNDDGQLIGVFELGHKEPFKFSKLVLYKLEEVIFLCTAGTLRWLREMDNNLNLFIQQQYTSIHPSVEWKFQQVARNFIWEQRFKGGTQALEPIVFKSVYPLYGQADIVGSSLLRNESIQADLVDNLQRVLEVMKICREKIEFQLLDVYITTTEAILKRLQNGRYQSSDETEIVELLTLEVHPLLRQLCDRFAQLPQSKLSAYFNYLDPQLDIVYRQRKDYEDSVRQLNHAISDFIEQEDEKKQKLIPHFFEKYTTDGVEYNIYLGQSLLREGRFSPFFLQDFRLWQLLQMCEITRLVKRISTDLPVPLTTAQLIFVYNNPLSIRFQMDEKQFDVDGAYNVRYEILKKRIDKAVVKGVGERLTQSGKIAVVWLQEKDRLEYLKYLHHLQDEGFISEDIEELELEKLQGADGLKALRATVLV